MTRNGKIARLPREIRDELNQRLDNGEQGVRLVAWLNDLPEVKKVLESDFEGRAISEVNLTEWKAGGYEEWLAQKNTAALVREMAAQGKEIAEVSENQSWSWLGSVMAARYGALLLRWNGEVTDEFRGQVRGMRGLNREVARLQRNDQWRERMRMEREWMELEREKMEPHLREKFDEWVKDLQKRKRFQRELTQKEKDEAFQAILFPKGLMVKPGQAKAPEEGNSGKSGAGLEGGETKG